jgi:hypothetical protein
MQTRFDMDCVVSDCVVPMTISPIRRLALKLYSTVRPWTNGMTSPARVLRFRKRIHPVTLKGVYSFERSFYLENVKHLITSLMYLSYFPSGIKCRALPHPIPLGTIYYYIEV